DLWRPRHLPTRGVRPVRVDPAGLTGPTRGQARGSRWRSIGRGWFVPSDVPASVDQRILEASVHLPDGGVVSGWAACRLHGGGFFDGLDRDGRTHLPVNLVVPVGCGTRQGPGLTVSRETLAPREKDVVHGIACAAPGRAVLDAMRWAPDLRSAVVVADAALAAGLVTRVDPGSGRAGVEQVRRAARLSSERTRSPAETRFRLIWTLDAGLPSPWVNCPVADPSGKFVAEVDLLDPVLGLVGEYDGAHHRSAAQHTTDVRREDALRNLGLEYVTATGRDLTQPHQLVTRILAARDRASRVPANRRTFLIKTAAEPARRQPD
ncbi:MAG: hypothetical protein ACJ72D_25485, partial [Marmoricola sp.]